MIKNKATLTLVFFVFIAAILSGCSFTQSNPAPITDLRNQKALQRGYHVVKPGETLYFIAWRYGKDFRDLANVNDLQPPYSVHVGQKIYLKGKTTYYQYQPQRKARPATGTTKRPLHAQSSTYTPVKHWLMPAKGHIVENYSATNKGINIAGNLGEPILATAAGTVVYAGAGIPAYGNLLIIKHNDIYLSAYAHNRKLLVKEGQSVKAGQEIATMGSTGTNRVMLHFELRKRGKPVNPLKYLK